jgi:hypothetical protein
MRDAHQTSALSESDDVLVAYRAEPARAPRMRPWHTWEPKWRLVSAERPLPDTSLFSSNDWVAEEKCLHLTKACPPE